MIHTITFNPSLDYIVRMPELKPGKTNRSQSETLYPGGKGINVSIVLSNLGLESHPMGFAAGFTGREIERLLEAYGCAVDFIRLPEGFSRINVKIKAELETEINTQGPHIPAGALETLYQKLDVLRQGDLLVLAGSIPNTLPEDLYQKIMERLRDREIQVVVDATKDLLLNVLPYRPFLIKPNQHELGELFGKELHDKTEIAAHAKLLQRRGARNVLVSMGGDGALLADETGAIHSAPAPEGVLVNSVGAGDSMVAGFLAGYLRTGSYEKAFRLGLAAGSATAFRDWLATGEDVKNLLVQTGDDGLEED